MRSTVSRRFRNSLIARLTGSATTAVMFSGGTGSGIDVIDVFESIRHDTPGDDPRSYHDFIEWAASRAPHPRQLLVKLAEPHCRFFLMLKTQDLRRREQAMELARIRFVEIFGEEVEEWDLAVHRQSLTSSWFVCAAKSSVVEDLRALEQRLPDTSLHIRSDFLCAFNSCHGAFPASSASFLYATDFRTYVCRVRRGELLSVNIYSEQLVTDDKLTSLIGRDEILSGSPTPMPGFLLAPAMEVQTDHQQSTNSFLDLLPPALRAGKLPVTVRTALIGGVQ